MQKVTEDKHRASVAGSVSVARMVYLDLSVGIDTYDTPIDSTDTIVIRVNGRPVKTMTPYQAARLGLIPNA